MCSNIKAKPMHNCLPGRQWSKGCAENNVCCEVKLSHSAEYCVLPERGAFMADGAKCKVSIGCRTEVSPTDYGKIDVERVNPCAEGLTCCKQARRSAAGTSARTGVRDNNKCTSTGGARADIRNTVCLKEDTSLDLIPFVAGKCLSNRASWYQCCPSGLVQGTSSEFYPDILEDATRNICTTASGTCKASCGTGEIKELTHKAENAKK